MKGRCRKGQRGPPRQEGLLDVTATQGQEDFPHNRTDPAKSAPKPTAKRQLDQISGLFWEPNPRRRRVTRWLQSVGSSRNIRDCPSESQPLLRPTDDEGISRRIASSLPAMDLSRNAENGFVPPMVAPFEPPVDVSSRSEFPFPTSFFTTRQEHKRRVERPMYRLLNLASNKISLRPSREPLPYHVAELVALVQRDRDSPGITHDPALQDQELEKLDGNVKEEDVAAFFRQFILPAKGEQGCLQRTEKQPMLWSTVPNTAPDFPVSKPVPDMLYGYNIQEAFPDKWLQLMPLFQQVAANNESLPLLYPFFSIKFKGEMGSMWVATNQCLGASSSCVRLAEDLNCRLKQCRSNKVIHSTIFSLATNGSEARLYVSWKQDEANYYTATFRRLLLQDPEQYVKLNDTIRSIIDWGCGQRLDDIREAMDILLAAGKKSASEVVESHPLPRPDPPSRSQAKPKRKPNKEAKAANEPTQKIRRSNRIRKQTKKF